MITLNDAPYKENVSELIERAHLQGVLIDYSDGRLSLKIPEAVEVSQALLDELRSSKEQLIHFFRHRKTLSAKSSNPDKSIRSFLDQRVLDQTRMPLSFSQERLWVLDKLTGSNHYHIPLAIKWRGLLNEEYFEIALNKIIERHEVLRTVFKEYDGDVYQVVLQPFESKLCIEKISAVGEYAQLDIYLKNELQKPFDLSSDIKVRASIVSVSDHEHVVFFVFHHIATDGWSGSIFLNEFLQGYRALAKGQPIQLAELPIQYAEYAYWERNVLTDTALESKLMYWKEHLKDVQSIDLPVDFSRKVQRDKTGGGCSHILDASTTQLIRDIIIDQEVTLFMLMHTAISVLLFRYTGQTDICVATPVANRYFKEVEPLIGFFLNNLILRNDLSGNPPFSELLQKVKNNTLEAYDYQDVPFEKIVEALGIARDSSENPLFQVTITMHSHSSLATPIAQDDIEIELFSLEQETALFDLSFHISEQGDCIELGINYAADLFDQRTIAQMLTNLGVLLQSVVRDIHCPIEEMAVISAESISALKQEQDFYLNASFPVNKSIVSLFEEQVMTSPHRIAVSFEDETCTYATLNQRANQLADYLVQKGLPKEGLVMLCLERSVNMIVSMLAVAKAGGAYLPIGHDFPSNRVAFMLADAAPTFVVCQDSTQGLFEAVPTPCLINIDTVADELEGFSTSNLELEIKPDQLLYVIYTSGTTGQPKGAMITHQNVVRLFKTSPSYFDFSGEDVWSLFHNYYFDFSVWEIYGALLFGGRIEVVAEKIVKDTPAFLRFLSEKKVTVLSQTPAAFYNLQEVASIDRPMLQVRYVIFGGEALHPAKLNFWHNQYPACKLINMYGITETTVHVTYKEIGKTEIENGCSNIGKPIPTLGVFVLDKHHNLLPKGASGELFVTGYGLAKGYLNRAELTATRFIQIPALGNQYFYKTGDIVQMSPDGDLRYIGRTDHQVKIRGHRIELGEIENTLLQIQGINQCCVILYTTAANIQQLVAYFVSDKAVDKQQLKKALAKTLPAYMIPAVFIPVNKLPINENGKIDRKSLPVPSEADLVRSEHVHPSTVIECKLAEIWKRLLQLQYIGIHDNFFTVGGDSILVIKAISELQKEFSVQMPVVEFYNSPTIADVASYIEVGMLHSSAPISGLDKVNEYITNLAHDVIKAYHTTYELEDAYPMTDIQKGMVFASIADRENAVYHDQMAYPIRDVHIDTFKQALALVVQKHPILRTAYNLSDFKEEVQLVFKDVPVEVSTYDIADLSSKEQEQRLVDYQRKERERPFDFAVAPLWRATIFNCGNNISVHVFQFHHSILDGWSFASLVQELNEVYWALLNNPYHSLNLLQCNWRDVISNSLLQKADERGLEYWKQKLADYKRTSFFTEEEVQERLVVAFDYQKLTLLKSIAIEFNVSLKTIFLGIYLQVVRLFTYHREVTIGLVANTRPYQQDGEKILGCFLNTIPFRYEFSTTSIKWKDYLDDIERELLKLKSFDQVTLFEIAKSMGEQVHDKSPFFDLIFNFTDFHVLHAMPTELDYQEEALYETQSLHLPEYTATNTFLDCTVSITGNQLKFGYWQRKAFAEGISLASMGEAITTIMDSFLQNPAASIDPASFLLPSDQAIIHHKFNQTDYTFDGPKTLVALLEQQATQTPSAIATTIGNNQLSYAALHQKAKQLAHILLTYTTVSNQPIAVCLERSNEMMVAILAILKAGGAYVPLDPWYPVAHLAYVVNDTQTRVVITEKRFASLFEQSEHLTCLFMDELPEVAVSDLPLPAVMPQQAAYVIYTSGSTGQPKGVVISHESIVNRLLWMQQTYWLQPDVDIVLQKTTYCFDVSVWELFWPLITGSKLVFAKPGGHKESQYLKTLIEEEGITTVHFVPSMLEVFLLYIKPGDCPSLQRVICSGEALLPAHVNTFNQKLPGATLHNLYGPTEAAVDVTYWEAPKNESVYVVPIGKPVANTRLYVVREDGLPCGIGVPGELHIAGIQLAKGYLNKPELTHAKFVYSEVAKERVYKTGDLAYWMPDGNIGYLGRIDQQVKIRGHRIELGEIEQVLLEAPGVWQSAVTVVADAVEGKKMYAYVVANDSTDRQQLLDFVASRLPDFMVPSTIIFLDEMPLTANGKLNRSALPVPTENDFRNVVYEAPVNSVERTMAQIWMTYLGLSKVGRNDHFFQVGGNSLTATRVVIAIQKEWGLALSVKDIFQYPVLETLCKYIALESLQDKQDEEQAIYDL